MARTAHSRKPEARLALAVALGVDVIGGEPPASIHPVVWMGRTIALLERRAPCGEGRRLIYGAGMVALCAGLFVLPAWLLEQSLQRVRGQGGALGVALGTVALGLCLKPAFAVRALLRATADVGAALTAEDLPGAREALRSLVSRDTATLPPPLLAAAAIESVAENSSDSVVAPLFYFVLWGLPGAMAYRVVNTLDAMIGYRTPRYEHLGKVAAYLDDLANLLPARLTGLLFVLAAPAVGGRPVEAWRVMRRDHRLTASPNAGWPMSAAAGALGVTLEKAGCYRLNLQGRQPTGGDVWRALRLTRAALALGIPLLLGLVAGGRGRHVGSRPAGRWSDRRREGVGALCRGVRRWA